jgi:DNA repair protein RecO (recombination protein O)
VLHKRWSGDTSAQVTFFTQEQGLISALYKGGRSPNRQALLQAFTPLWVLFNEHRDWHYVHKLEATAPSMFLTGYCLFAGLYINELIYHALRPQDSHAMLYDAYQETLHTLSIVEESLAIEMVLRRFEWALLETCGYSISLTQDVASGMPIIAECRYALFVDKGFVAAEQGMPGAHILAFANGKLDDPAVLKSAKWMMRRVLDHLLEGKVLKSRELLVALMQRSVKGDCA